MPSWKVHIIFNLVFIIPLVLLLTQFEVINNLLVSLSIIVFSSISSLIPDLDTPKSKIRDKFSMLIAGTIILYLMISFTIESVLVGVSGFIILYLFLRFYPTRHRGATHTFKFGLAFSLIFSILLFFVFESSILELAVYFLAISFGYFSHIVLDKL